MEIEQYAVAAAAIVGLVNGFRLIGDKDYKGFVFFALALASGLFFGHIHWFGLPSMEVGLLVALASSGLYRVGQLVGGK